MPTLKEIEEQQEQMRGSPEDHDEWATRYGDLLIRAVRQLGACTVTLAERDIMDLKEMDLGPDVLELLEESK